MKLRVNESMIFWHKVNDFLKIVFPELKDCEEIVFPKLKHFEQLDRTGTLLNAEQATLFRALAARINYVSIDRADVAFAAKELCRDCSAPTNESVEALKKVVR